jgi:phosphopantetheine--protein transferase-like protein
MNPLVRVGNDVVDLSRPRVRGKSRDDRFVSRVLGEEERSALAAATDPDLELWCLWAAKEAAYKIASKLRERPPVFTHADFQVTWTGRGKARAEGECTVREGVVVYEGTRTPVEVRHQLEVLHAIAHSGPADGPRTWIAAGKHRLEHDDGSRQDVADRLRDRLTPAEVNAVHSHASAAARVHARSELARAMRVDESRLEIVNEPGPKGRRPPRVLMDGTQAVADVSLSHDGRWIAWALWVGPEAGRGLSAVDHRLRGR